MPSHQSIQLSHALPRPLPIYRRDPHTTPAAISKKYEPINPQALYISAGLKKLSTQHAPPDLYDIDAYLATLGIKRETCRLEKSILKEYDFFKFEPNIIKRHFCKTAPDATRSLQLALALFMFKDITIKNILFTIENTLYTIPSFTGKEISSMLTLMCHALDYFDIQLLKSTFNSSKALYLTAQDLKNLPQNKLFNPKEKFEGFFYKKCNLKNITNTENDLTESKNRQFSEEQIAYLKYLTQEAKEYIKKNSLAEKIKLTFKNNILYKIYLTT